MKVINKILALSTSTVFILGLFLSPSVQAFDPSEPFTTEGFYSSPLHIDGPESIQKILEENGSYLANYTERISLSVNDPVAKNLNLRTDIQNKYKPSYTIRRQNLKASEIIWELARGNLGASCSYFFFSELCFTNEYEPINPAFLLALIQKESGLIYGDCAKVGADTNTSCFYTRLISEAKINYENLSSEDPNELNPETVEARISYEDRLEAYSLQGRLKRTVGYYCFENDDKSKSCWDENPDWLIYKGFFRQLFHATRRLRLLEQACEKGGKYAFFNSRGTHTVGATMQFGDETVTFKNGITCALYIYTPHVSSQKLLRDVMDDLDSFDSWKVNEGIPVDYKPPKLSL